MLYKITPHLPARECKKHRRKTEQSIKHLPWGDLFREGVLQINQGEHIQREAVASESSQDRSINASLVFLIILPLVRRSEAGWVGVHYCALYWCEVQVPVVLLYCCCCYVLTAV